MRIGHGYDAHRFDQHRPLILGGVQVPHSHGLAGHSDADVLLHAICDAILGALGLGDIGGAFPDTDPALTGINSRILLRDVVYRMNEMGFVVGNLDTTVIAQVPRLAPYITKMRENIAADLNCATGCVNVKATTTERMGFTGREEGIASHAVVLLVPK